MFKINDCINFIVDKELKIIGEDRLYYLFEDPSGVRKKFYKEDVDRYGKLIKPTDDKK